MTSPVPPPAPDLLARAAYSAFCIASEGRLGSMPRWEDIPPEARADWRAVADGVLLTAQNAFRDQAQRYLRARFGDDYVFRAPETFGAVDRWIWCVAGDAPRFGDRCIRAIEEQISSARKETP